MTTSQRGIVILTKNKKQSKKGFLVFYIAVGNMSHSKATKWLNGVKRSVEFGTPSWMEYFDAF